MRPSYASGRKMNDELDLPKIIQLGLIPDTHVPYARPTPSLVS
jgi:hypothetical protein